MAGLKPPTSSGTGGASAMDDLTDADTTSVAPSVGGGLVWDGANWVPRPPTHTVNFGDYNPDDTGVTDTKTVLESACLAAGAGGTVYIPPGTYLISSPADLQGASLVGAGPNTSTFTADTGTATAAWQVGPRANDVALLYSRNHDNVSITGIGVDGQDQYVAGIAIFGGRNIHVWNTYVRDCANCGIQLFGTMESADDPIRDAILSLNLVENCRWNLVVDGEAYEAIVTMNVSRTPTNRHISFDSQEAQGITSAPGDEVQYGTVVSFNTMEGERTAPAAWSDHPSSLVQDGAIRTKTLSNVSIVSNSIRNWSGQAIYAQGANGLISDNVLIGTSGTPIAKGILVASATGPLSLKDNFGHYVTTAVEVDDSDDLHISGSHFTSVTTALSKSSGSLGSRVILTNNWADGVSFGDDEYGEATALEYAVVQRTSSQSIPNATETVITWQSEVADTGSFWASGSPTRFTVAEAGLYLLSGSIRMLSNATGVRFFFMRKNGATTLFRH
jgi:hypothetical protein